MNILALTSVLGLSMGVGMTSAPIYNEEPAPIYQRQYENDSSTTTQEEQEFYDYHLDINQNTWKQTIRGSMIVNPLEIPKKAAARYANKKYEDQAVTQIGTLSRTRYDSLNISRYDVNDLRTGWLIDCVNAGTTNTDENEWNNSLEAIAFYPNYNTTNSNIRLQYDSKLRCTFTVLTDTILPQGRYRAVLKRLYTCYYTYNLDWSTYLNRSCTYNPFQNRDWLNEIKTGVYGTNYGIKTEQSSTDIGYLNPNAQQDPFAMEEYIPYYATTDTVTTTTYFTVPAVKDKTNYYIISSKQVIRIYDETDSDVTEDLILDYGLKILGMYDSYPTNASSSYNNLNTTAVEDNWCVNHANRLRIYGQFTLPITQEVIDIPNVMFTVLGMPFTFISTGLNLTIFPGTNYAVNIGNLLLMLIAVGTFIFLLKIILKVKG